MKAPELYALVKDKENDSALVKQCRKTVDHIFFYFKKHYTSLSDIELYHAIMYAIWLAGYTHTEIEELEKE